MTLNLLPGVPSAGNLAVTFIPADTASFDPEAPSVAILNGATAVTVQCLMPAGTYTGVTTSVNQIPKRRACTRTPYYVEGDTDKTVDAIQVVYDPQDPTAEISAGYVALAPGTRWYMIDRRGIDGQSEYTADEYMDTHLVKVLARNKPHSEEEGDEITASIIIAYQGESHEDVQAVA